MPLLHHPKGFLACLVSARGEIRGNIKKKKYSGEQSLKPRDQLFTVLYMVAGNLIENSLFLIFACTFLTVFL